MGSDAFVVALAIPAVVSAGRADALARLDEVRPVWVWARRACLIGLLLQAATLAGVVAMRSDGLGVPELAGVGLFSLLPAGLGLWAARDALIPGPQLAWRLVRPALAAAIAPALSRLLSPSTLAALCWASLAAALAGFTSTRIHDTRDIDDGTCLDVMPRETLAALEQLTSPSNVQRRIVSELSRAFPGARLELLRASWAPRDILTLENALRASPRETSVELILMPHDLSAEIVVQDQGHGIDPNDLPHVFDPFFTTRSDGTGLGLAICKKIVAAHGGALEARPRSTGTQFRLALRG